MITKEQAMELHHGQVIYRDVGRNADGSPLRYRVNGKCKTWVTRPDEFRVPLKQGFYGHDYLDQRVALSYHLTEEDALDSMKRWGTYAEEEQA